MLILFNQTYTLKWLTLKYIKYSAVLKLLEISIPQSRKLFKWSFWSWTTASQRLFANFAHAASYKGVAASIKGGSNSRRIWASLPYNENFSVKTILNNSKLNKSYIKHPMLYICTVNSSKKPPCCLSLTNFIVSSHLHLINFRNSCFKGRFLCI